MNWTFHGILSTHHMNIWCLGLLMAKMLKLRFVLNFTWLPKIVNIGLLNFSLKKPRGFWDIEFFRTKVFSKILKNPALNPSVSSDWPDLVVFTNLNWRVQKVCSLCFGCWMHLELKMLDARCARSFLHRVTEGWSFEMLEGRRENAGREGC